MHLFARTLRRSFHERLYTHCHNDPNIINLSRTLGPWDYEVGIASEDSYQAPAAVRRLHAAFNECGSLAARVQPAFKHLTLGLIYETPKKAWLRTFESDYGTESVSERTSGIS